MSPGVTNGVPAATSWTVCASGCDYSSIKVAIAAPTTLDGDMLAIAAGTYTEAGIFVNKSLTLQGGRMATTIVQTAASLGTVSDRVSAIYRSVSVSLQELTIQYGRTTNAYSDGGGLSNFGTLTLTPCIVRGNRAIYASELFTRGRLILPYSTSRGNRATSSYGGGPFNNGGTLILAQSTVSGNGTESRGGGLLNYTQGMVVLTNSIVAKNPAGVDCSHRDPRENISDSYNLDSDGSRYLIAANNRPGVDPLLGPLQDSGGPTLTHALLPGSRAIDAIPWEANGCSTTFINDQRRQARP